MDAKKKLDGNYTRMLAAIMTKSRQEDPTKQQLYGHLPPISKTIPQNLQEIAGELRTNSLVTLLYDSLHMNSLMLADQQRFT